MPRGRDLSGLATKVGTWGTCISTGNRYAGKPDPDECDRMWVENYYMLLIIYLLQCKCTYELGYLDWLCCCGGNWYTCLPFST